MKIMVNKTYETWTSEDMEFGDTDKKGFVWEDKCLSLKELIDEIESIGPVEPSCTAPYAGTWFSGQADTNWASGETTIEALHPKLSERNMGRLCRILKAKKLLRGI